MVEVVTRAPPAFWTVGASVPIVGGIGETAAYAEADLIIGALEVGAIGADSVRGGAAGRGLPLVLRAAGGAILALLLAQFILVRAI